MSILTSSPASRRGPSTPTSSPRGAADATRHDTADASRWSERPAAYDGWKSNHRSARDERSFLVNSIQGSSGCASPPSLSSPTISTPSKFSAGTGDRLPRQWEQDDGRMARVAAWMDQPAQHRRAGAVAGGSGHQQFDAVRGPETLKPRRRCRSLRSAKGTAFSRWRRRIGKCGCSPAISSRRRLRPRSGPRRVSGRRQVLDEATFEASSTSMNRFRMATGARQQPAIDTPHPTPTLRWRDSDGPDAKR